MPELGIFVLGAIVTAVAVWACIVVGRAEEEDARVRELERSERRRNESSGQT